MGKLREELSQQLRSFTTATTIALAVVFSTFAGVLTGYFIDRRLLGGRVYPWCTVIGLLLGLAGGVKNFFILGKRFSEEARRGQGSRGSSGGDGGTSP